MAAQASLFNMEGQPFKQQEPFTDQASYNYLLGLADFFRQSQPPRLRETIHCLQATLSIENLPLIDKARCRLNLAKLLLQHTRNVGHARAQLEQAHQISSFSNDLESQRLYFDSTSILSSVCTEQGQGTLAKSVLRNALNLSVESSLKHWHYRLLFQLAEAHARDKEFKVAIDLLSVLGEAAAQENGHHYIKVLYMLSKCMLHLANNDLEKFMQASNHAESAKQEYISQSGAQSVYRREVIKIFSGFLKVYYYIITGRPKTGKDELKELQRSIQMLAAIPDEVSIPDDPESFHWMSKDHLCILVYLVTVMHSMHAGSMDRALRHSEKALSLIEKLKAVGNENHITMVFNLSLLEHAVMCRIIQGQGSQAIQEIGKACQLCSQDNRLMTFKPVIHTLLGLYGMSMNVMVDAEEHFKKALRLSSHRCDIYCLAALNLAIIYIRHGPAKSAMVLDTLLDTARYEVDTLEIMKQYTNVQNSPPLIKFRQLLESLDSDTITRSKNLRSSYFYMMGLKTFFDSNYEDSKKFLGESLRISNTEELSRMTACSLILLGHVITSLQNPQEASTMVIPALQVANKIPDVYLQLWAASLLKDIYHMMADVAHEQEGAQLHNMYTTQLLQDHFTAGQRSEHSLLKDFI